VIKVQEINIGVGCNAFSSIHLHRIVWPCYKKFGINFLVTLLDVQ
jgi:hypothetical protein